MGRNNKYQADWCGVISHPFIILSASKMNAEIKADLYFNRKESEARPGLLVSKEIEKYIAEA